MSQRVFITKEMHEALTSERCRTGVSSALLIKFSKDKPNKLTSSIISSWFNLRTETCALMHWNYVMNLYAKLPDNPWITITTEDSKLLRKFYDQNVGNITRIFKKNPPPNDYTYEQLITVLIGRNKKCRKNLLQYALKLVNI